MTISFSMLGKFSTIISSKIFSYPFFFSSSGTLWFKCWCVWHCPRGIWNYPQYFFHSFYFTLLFRSYFHHFIFQLTDSFFCFRYSAIDYFQSIFNFSNCIVVSVCLFFNSSWSLLIGTCILFLRFLIILTILFQVVSLFPLHLFGLCCF